MTPELWDAMNPIGEELANLNPLLSSLYEQHPDLFDAEMVQECYSLADEAEMLFSRLWDVARELRK